MKIEMIVENNLVTYAIKFNKEKVKKVIKEIKEYSKEREIEFHYDAQHDDEKSYAKIHFNFDEYLGSIKKTNNEENYDLNLEEELEDEDFLEIWPGNNRLYGGPCILTGKVKVKNYPVLYNVIFGKYTKYNDNIFNSILLYLTNKCGLKNGGAEDDYIGVSPIFRDYSANVAYDHNIDYNKKIRFIMDILNCMEVTIEKIESIDILLVGIENISDISLGDDKKITNLKDKLISEVNKRIDKAKSNRDCIDKIFKLLYRGKLDSNIEKIKIFRLQNDNNSTKK